MNLYKIIISYFLSAIMISSCSLESKLELVKPTRLEVGDTIAFCAPSGFLDSSRMALARKRLIEKGFHIVYDDSLLRNWGYLAGKDKIRANELMTYFEDKSIKAIFPGTGGYGATRILSLLDYNIINDNPKIFASDFLAIAATVEESNPPEDKITTDLFLISICY